MSEILERIARGDDTAVAACLEEYSGLVWRLARRRLRMAPQEVDDAVQEVFVELWLSAGRFDRAKGSEASFVATVAHRRLIDHQRRVESRRMAARRAALERAGAAGASGSAARVDGGRAAAAAFDGLPEDERRVVWMSVHNGLSHGQIAAAMDSPIGTIKTRLRRAVARLRASLGAEEWSGAAA